MKWKVCSQGSNFLARICVPKFGKTRNKLIFKLVLLDIIVMIVMVSSVVFVLVENLLLIFMMLSLVTVWLHVWTGFEW